MTSASPLRPESQPENYAAIQDFLHWKCDLEIHKDGCGGSKNTVGIKYISQAALVKKLTRERIETLLNELFRDTEHPAPDANFVIRHYLRPFAILLSAGSGRMISHFVEHLSLRDHLLPFTVESKDFPKSTRGDLYKVFCKEQWQFCPVKLEYNMSYRLESNYILPIVQKEKIGDGGSAEVYKIVVDEEYDSLKPSKSIDASASRVSPNTYVLKTYRTLEAEEYFETERSAFRKLRYGGMPPGNIIEYYGSFVRDGTYNIILEYADRGTLDQYMNNMDEPTDIGEIMTFWKCFLAIFHGLDHIHGTKSPSLNPDEPGSLLGWHHDISPDNILVVSRKAGSPYECDFKIADLGLSHFRRHSSSSRDDTDEDKYGSNAYGAPETYRSPDSEESQRSHLQVSQSADIWSMGCILSEVITWVTEGRRKLRDYRRRRLEEVGEDRFHCNGEVLDTVSQLHDDLMQNRRVHDYVTPTIVQGLVHSSIVIDHQSRASAHQLFYQSGRILGDAQKKLERRRYHAVSDGVLEMKKRLPPNLPPKSSTSSTETFKVEMESQERGDLGQTSGHRVWSNGLQERDTHSEWVQHANVPVPVHNSNGNRKHTISSERSQAQHQQPNFTHRRMERVSSQPVSPSMHRQNNTRSSAKTAQMEKWSQQNPLGIIADTYENTQASYFPLRSPRNRHSAASAGGLALRPSTTEGISHLPELRHLDPFVERGVDSSDLLLEASECDEECSPRYRPALKDRPHPQMSVNEGLTIKRARERGQNVRYPDQDLFQTLDAVLRKRDHAFLIDNAESMGQHRDQVRRVLELLSYMTQRYDPDGLDLCFSTESGKHKPKDNEQMLRYFDERPAHGLPDMRERFASIIEQYQARFGKRNILSKLLHFDSTPTIGPRRLSLYVLTDGVWQPGSTLVTEIKRLVSLLQEHKLPNKHIGIQFIRFGNNAEGKRRLQKLDSGLGLELDIIDTTSADGNVWKMLLGGVNDWFDDDHDEITDDEREP